MHWQYLHVASVGADSLMLPALNYCNNFLSRIYISHLLSNSANISSPAILNRCLAHPCRRLSALWHMIYLLTAIGLSPGGSSTVHIYTQTIQYGEECLLRRHSSPYCCWSLWWISADGTFSPTRNLITMRLFHAPRYLLFAHHSSNSQTGLNRF